MKSVGVLFITIAVLFLCDSGRALETTKPEIEPATACSREGEANIVFIAGTAFGVLLGVLVGENIKKSISEEEALKSVKEARKPRVVEYFSEREASDSE